MDLTYFFKTKSQANDFSSRLATVSENIYQTDFNLDQALMEAFGIQKKDKFLSLLRDNNVNVESASALKAFFTKIQKEISTLPVLTLTVAFEPKGQTLQAIAEWFVLNTHKQMLFEIVINYDLIAGAALNYNGKFIDCSIRPVFAKTLQAHQLPIEQSPPPTQPTTQTTLPEK